MTAQPELNLSDPGEGITLKRCPFCGSGAEKACRAVICSGCGCWMPPPKGRIRFDLAAGKWNRRVDVEFLG